MPGEASDLKALTLTLSRKAGEVYLGLTLTLSRRRERGIRGLRPAFPRR